MANVAFKGFVGKVHGLKFNDEGKPRFSFSVAEGHSRFNKQRNEWEDTGTTWWAVTVFGKDAENVASWLAEGQKQLVCISGRSSTREYEANGETRTSLDVIADFVGQVHRAPAQPTPSAWQSSPQGTDWGTPQNQPPAQPQTPTQPPADPWTGEQGAFQSSPGDSPF